MYFRGDSLYVVNSIRFGININIVMINDQFRSLNFFTTAL